MKPIHVAISLLAGILVYFVSNILIGPYSPTRYSELSVYYADLHANIENLEMISSRLETRYYYLKDDAGAIIQEAHRIGMLFPDESSYQLDGRKQPAQSMSPGSRLTLNSAPVDSAATVRALGLSAAIICFAAFIATAGGGGGRRRRMSESLKDIGRSMEAAAGTVGRDMEMGQSMRVHVASRE